MINEVIHEFTFASRKWKRTPRHAGMDSRHPGSQGCFGRRPCRSGFQPSMLEWRM